MVEHGAPERFCSDNGPEMVAASRREWLSRVDSEAMYIQPGSPSGSGYCESFIRQIRDELLSDEIFCTLKKAQVLTENW